MIFYIAIEVEKVFFRYKCNTIKPTLQTRVNCIVVLGFNTYTGKHFPIFQNACLIRKDYFFTIFLISNVFPFSTFSKKI